MVVRLTVTGRVQGVWFRASTRDEALHLGLCGHVRNMIDGRVEIVASGPDERIDELIKWAHKGPPMSRVSDVQIETGISEPTSNTFEVIF